MIRQSKYLFLGGPWDGLWRSVPHGANMWRVPIMPTRYEAAPDFGAMDTREAHYHLRRVLIPGWFVPLTIYTTDPLRQAPAGTALPGLIQGSPIDAWSAIGPDQPVWLAEAAHDLHDAIRERRYRP